MQLKEAIELFLGQYKKITRRTYYYSLNPMAQEIGPARLVTEITELDLIRYTNKLKGNEDLSPATVRKHIKSIKTFFNWLIARELVEKSVAAGVKNVTYDPYISRDKAMAEDDLQKLLTYMDRNQQLHIRHRALVLFLADTGCRAGGAAGLRWADIDLTTGTAIVTEKGDKTRPAWFFELTTFALMDWRDSQERTQGEYVFSHRGGRITSASLQQLFRRLCQRAGIGSHGPHKMRHRKAHQMIDAGESVTDSAIAIGDEPETFMRHYAPRDFESARAAARRAALRTQKDKKIVQIRRSQDKHG